MLSQRQLFLQHVAQTSPAPLMLEIESASGLYLYDIHGKKYIDLISGISVNNIGHCHPAVVKAVQEQAAQYMHLMVYGEYVYAPQTQLSEKLCRWLGEPFDSVYLVNSGTEAIEGALKLAKRSTGRHEIVALKNAYHGSTHGSLSLQSQETFSAPFRPLLPGIRFAELNDTASLDVITEQSACVVCEVVQAETGYLPADTAFLKALRKKCDETGALLILDEIQSGFGRTGKPFAFMHHSIRPDIIVLAKGMGAGMPIGAFISSRKIMSVLSHDPVLGHITTFGGNPVCAAASLAMMGVLESEKWMAEVEEKERLFRSLLNHRRITQISGKGLMLALHLGSEEAVQTVIRDCLEKGLITDWFLFCPTALRVTPPLSITLDEIKEVCGILTKALDRLD